MTNEQILKKSIEKAIGNGYDRILGEAWFNDPDPNNREYFTLVFSHDFAKAFWKNEEKCPICLIEVVAMENGEFWCRTCNREVWERRLQQMVLEKEPLKYLEKFLEEGK